MTSPHPLPPDAPRVYARPGTRALDYIRRKGWLAGPRYVPRERHTPEIEARLAELKRLRNGGAL